MTDADRMFSIVTVNYNGEKFLKKFLDSLVNQTFSGFSLYFVDNGSKDNSLEIVETYRNSVDIKIITLDKNYGFAKANNIGIDHAMEDNSDYILTLNNDIEADKDCLENLRREIKKVNTTYDVFQILMINYFDRKKIDAAGLNFNNRYLTKQIGYKEDICNIDKFSRDISAACAGAAVYSKQSLKKVREENGDYFDSRFFAYYEDVDLGLRLLKKGFRTCFIKDAVVYHIHSGTANEGSDFKAYYISRNLFFYLKKNQSENEYNKNRVFYMMVFAKKVIICILKGEFSFLRSTLKGYIDFKNKIEPSILMKK